MTCPQRDAASEWVILPADGSDVVTVGDPYEARGRWYEHDLRYECEGEVTFEAYCNGADGLIAPLTVLVDGTAVGEVEQFTFLGFVDDS